MALSVWLIVECWTIIPVLGTGEDLVIVVKWIDKLS